MHTTDTIDAETGHAPRPETEAERQARIAWETARIAEADASIAAGRTISEEAVDAWMDSLGAERESSAPRSRR